MWSAYLIYNVSSGKLKENLMGYFLVVFKNIYLTLIFKDYSKISLSLFLILHG